MATEKPETAALLRRFSTEAGVVFDSDIDLSAASLDVDDCKILFWEQREDVEIVLPRIYSVMGSNPDLLAVIVVPAPRGAVDATLLSAGAFDVIDTGPDISSQMARTVAAARRVLALQEERSKLGADLAHQDKLAALGLLAAGVSHEINNPCGAILANVSAVRQQLESIMAEPTYQRSATLSVSAAEWIEAMDDCVGAARRINAIVKTLNVFSRRSETLPSVPIDVNEEIHTVLRLIGKEVRFQAKFEVTCDPDLPRIVAPPNTMTQILTNLLVNSLQALEDVPASKRRIWISTRFDDEYVMVEVGDNGPGIPADLIGKIFDPFFTTKPIGKGTGLGLSITRQLVEKAHGEIFVESLAGQGAQFRMVFERRGATTAPQPIDAAPSAMSNRLKVLIVEDDELTRRAILRWLSPQFDCLPLATAWEALEAIRAQRDVDVVLSDIVMPEMNGFEFYEAVRSFDPALAGRTAFMTGGVTSSDLRNSVTGTGRPLLNKPIDFVELIRTIRALGAPVAGGRSHSFPP